MKKKTVFIVIIGFVIAIFFIFLSNGIISQYSKEKVYSDLEEIPKNKVGLVLGTSKKLSDGRENLYFRYRIQAAINLYEAKKIEYILVSGDNSTNAYDEPTDFKKELIKNGIPEEKIYLDYAGFRTLDSVVRAKIIFGQEQITIISQKFHNERAIYLAEKNGILAIGYNAKDVPGRYGIRVQLREYLARTKAFVDILFGVGPKFLGEQVQIP
jgi:SanA protein